jgi:drug/metabolite transporter (DMT)-like permease
VTAILGGLAAAILWGTATLASSRSSRMIGSRVVLGWVMIVGALVGLPLAVGTGVPRSISTDALLLLLVAGICYSGGLYATYRALAIGNVSIVAPIVATEGAIAAVIAVLLGDEIGLLAASMLGLVAIGVVFAAIEPAHPDVPAGSIEITADAIEGPGPPAPHPTDARRTVVLSIVAAVTFGVGLVSAGLAVATVPPAWVALSSRLVGLFVVALPLVLQRRLVLTRAAAPLVIVAGTGEILGSTASAWGATESIAVVAVLGSQFAAFAAVVAFVLFGERLSRVQVAGVVLILVGVTLLAATSA